VIGIDRQRTIDQVLGLNKIAALSASNAKHMQGVEMIGVTGEDKPVLALCFGDIAGMMRGKRVLEPGHRPIVRRQAALSGHDDVPVEAIALMIRPSIMLFARKTVRAFDNISEPTGL
jgi:hypothetical protein